MAEYPTMLVRKGTSLQWSGHSLDTRVVSDEAAEKAARADGWISPHELGDASRKQAARPAKGKA